MVGIQMEALFKLHLHFQISANLLCKCYATMRHSRRVEPFPLLGPGFTFLSLIISLDIYVMFFADGAPWSSCRWFHKDRLQLTGLRHEQQNLFPIVRTGTALFVLGGLVLFFLTANHVESPYRRTIHDARTEPRKKHFLVCQSQRGITQPRISVFAKLLRIVS